MLIYMPRTTQPCPSKTPNRQLPAAPIGTLVQAACAFSILGRHPCTPAVPKEHGGPRPSRVFAATIGTERYSINTAASYRRTSTRGGSDRAQIVQRVHRVGLAGMGRACAERGQASLGGEHLAPPAIVEASDNRREPEQQRAYDCHVVR